MNSPWWVYRGSRLSQDDATLPERVAVDLGAESLVRPAEETPIPDWPVEDGVGQRSRSVSGCVLPSFLSRRRQILRLY